MHGSHVIEGYIAEIMESKSTFEGLSFRTLIMAVGQMSC